MDKYKNLSQAQFWSQRYQTGTDAWDQKTYHPQLEVCMKEVPEVFRQGKALVLGAGPGHDAHFIAQYNSNTVAIDFSEFARQSCLNYYPKPKFQYQIMDFFNPLETIKSQLVWEHTFLCAIDPNRYIDYFKSLIKITESKCHYAAIIWNQSPAGKNGPPFSVSNEIVINGIDKYFKIIKLEPVQKTYPGREGTETFFLAEKIS